MVGRLVLVRSKFAFSQQLFRPESIHRSICCRWDRRDTDARTESPPRGRPGADGMTVPRNRPAYERGQAIRATIRDYLDEQARLHRYGRRPPWKQIQAHLRTHNVYLERSAICYHVQQIELDELDRSPSD